jgi:NADH dehydrogenase
VARIVHVSIANPAEDSPLPYYRGKALVERALAASDVPYSIVRPTWFFGGRDILTNNIAWSLRKLPVFAVPGSGRYLVQPVHVGDFARLCLDAARSEAGATVDAAGPDRMTFEQLIRAVRDALGRRTPIVHAPPGAVTVMTRALGALLHDVLLTPDEIRGLTAGLLVSHRPALGSVSFLEWLRENASTLGRSYANELDRHFRERR